MDSASAEAKRAYQAKWYAKNRDRILAKSKALWPDIREKRAVYKKAYYAKNRETIKAKRAIYYADNREAATECSFRHYVSNYRHRLVSGARDRAEKKGREFDITVESVTWNTNCPCCGAELRYGGRGHVANSASLDRLDNLEGYTKLNTWVICRRCNSIKNVGAATEHRRIADAMDAIVSTRRAIH